MARCAFKEITMPATNVNTASAAELDAVPGLNGHGPEIVRYREERGGFSDLRQLKVDGTSAALTVGDAN
jgi:competence protein ComEA